MAFDKKTWANNQGGGTPLDASGLNDLESRIDDGIDELDVDLASHKADYPPVVDSGESSVGGQHFYEIYADGTAKAWGTRILTNVDITIAIGSFHRAYDTYNFGNIISFIPGTEKVYAFINGRSDPHNAVLMTPPNPYKEYNNFRIMQFSTSTSSDVTIFVDYEITGKVSSV